jgi:deoxycytidine triphosphate deaminase
MDRTEAASAIDLTTWSHPPAEEELTESFWKDPEPDFSGMLSADRIRGYNYDVGRMIRPFQDKNLKPAAYELTLGPRWSDGEVRHLSDESPLLHIPPNSIVFASMREMLLMPHWLAGRFDLAIEFIYQGLLLGTGPQVDPGFKGVLSCPLHNISNQTITLTYREPFAKIDFTKTSLGRVSFPALSGEDALFAGADARTLKGYEDEPLVLWKRNKNFRPPIIFAPHVTQVSSSVHDVDDDLRQVERFTKDSIDSVNARVASTDRQVRIGGFVGVIAFITALIALGSLLVTYVDGRIDDASAKPELTRLRADTRHLNHELEEAEESERRILRREEKSAADGRQADSP